MDTNWKPDPVQGQGSLYVRIASQIEEAIENGILKAGTKLPPQRNLAYDLGVTIGTIGRAYAIVREHGLVSGEVGRGTYVLERPVARPSELFDPVYKETVGNPAPEAGDNIHFDKTAAPDIGQGSVFGRLIGDIVQDHAREIANYIHDLPASWCKAGKEWLTNGTFRPHASHIVPILGVQSGAISVIASMTMPGDRIAFETLTYSQISRSAALIGRRAVLVGSDDKGLDPDDFDRVCAQQHPKLVFLMPRMQNPTAVSLPLERRQAVADIARKYGVWILEDDLYGAMTRDRMPLLAELAPERTFLVGGLSKSVAAGARGGWVACPPHYSQRVRVSHKMLSGGLPFLMAELSARLVLSGEAARLRSLSIEEIRAREDLAQQIFAGLDFNSHPHVPFLWLKLPEPWLSGTFKQAAFQEGVRIDDEDAFKAGRSDSVFHRVRIGFSSPREREEVRRGFMTLRRLLDSGPTGYDNYA